LIVDRCSLVPSSMTHRSADHRLKINDQKLNDRRSIDDERSTINDQRPTINDQREFDERSPRQSTKMHGWSSRCSR
jgi:hypothetical protein